MWEDGKRVEWFDETQIKQIEKGSLDYKTFFRKTESWEYVVSEKPVFGEPIDFKLRLRETKSNFPLKPIPELTKQKTKF